MLLTLLFNLKYSSEIKGPYKPSCVYSANQLEPSSNYWLINGYLRENREFIRDLFVELQQIALYYFIVGGLNIDNCLYKF